MNILERCARALCARHYAARFGKLVDDPHVQMNVDGNWHLFMEDAVEAAKNLIEYEERE